MGLHPGTQRRLEGSRNREAEPLSGAGRLAVLSANSREAGAEAAAVDMC